jgi:hypothetical protein
MGALFRSMFVTTAALTGLLSGLLVAACGGEPGWSGQLAVADMALFQSTAYPVLMRDCAFSECHGSGHRFFQVYGPGRTRLPATTKTDDPVTATELQVSYQYAVSMLATDGDANVATSLLLKKPLEAQNGGVGHRGVDDFGRNVYASAQVPGYQALLRWAQTAGRQPLAAGPPGIGNSAGGAP